jgi:hypothetical protein
VIFGQNLHNFGMFLSLGFGEKFSLLLLSRSPSPLSLSLEPNHLPCKENQGSTSLRVVTVIACEQDQSMDESFKAIMKLGFWLEGK